MLHDPKKVPFGVGTVGVVSDSRNDRFRYDDAPSCAHHFLRELIDGRNVDRVDRCLVAHTLSDRPVNAGLVAIISTDEPILDRSFPLVNAPVKNALVKRRCSRRVVGRDFKMDDFRLVSQLKFIANFLKL